jgi:transposase-like protein
MRPRVKNNLCPHCHGTLVKNGKRSTNFKDIQRWICRDCGKSMVFRKYPGTNFPDFVIDQVLQKLENCETVESIAFEMGLRIATVWSWGDRYL